ncbi:glycoside hydrolase family 130 protein [Flavobacterium sp.]
MVNVKKEGILLEKTDLPFESEGVLNPGVIQEGNDVHIFYRALNKGNRSTLGYCRLDGPLKVAQRNEEPIIIPQFDFDSQGVEDARVVKIESVYHITYTSYNGKNALGTLATSTDLKKWENTRIIVPQITYEEFNWIAQFNRYITEKYQYFYLKHKPESELEKSMLLWDKNVVFFPRKVHGQYCFFHRILPEIQLVRVNSLEDLTKEYWHDYFLTIDKHVILSPKYPHEISYIGGGCPPIETEEGWVVIYHGVHDVETGHVYTACAALLDIDNPSIELSRLPYALFTPDLDWEITGVVNNVVFPSGTSLFGDTLYVYYGAADKLIGTASMSLKELVAELVHYKHNPQQA